MINEGIVLTISYEIVFWLLFFIFKMIHKRTFSGTKANNITDFAAHLCFTFAAIIPMMLIVLGSIAALVILVSTGLYSLFFAGNL